MADHDLQNKSVMLLLFLAILYNCITLFWGPIVTLYTNMYLFQFLIHCVNIVRKKNILFELICHDNVQNLLL